MNKRTTLMVAYDILNIAQGGATKTQLVYRGNLNFRLIKKWLSRLIAKRLIAFSDNPYKHWTTTEKGLRFISAMDKVKTIWDHGHINMNEMKQEMLI